MAILHIFPFSIYCNFKTENEETTNICLYNSYSTFLHFPFWITFMKFHLFVIYLFII